MRIDDYDSRTGGSYRCVHVGDDGEFGFYGAFHEVRRSERIIQTFTFEGRPDGVALERLLFDDLGDGRIGPTGTSLVDSFEDSDAFVASGMEYGVREGYERLDESCSPADRPSRRGGWRWPRRGRAPTTPTRGGTCTSK